MWINYFKDGKPETIETQDIQQGNIKIICVDIANGEDCTFYGSVDDFCKQYVSTGVDSQEV